VILSAERPIRGTVDLPGDKSISHRAAIMAALASGETQIQGYAPGTDAQATLNCLMALGVGVSSAASGISIRGSSLSGLKPPDGHLNCMNSGTTMRLLSGVLAAQRFPSVLTGDSSLRSRPMARIVEPLTKMGARVCAEGDSNTAPLAFFPPKEHRLRGLDCYRLPVASAQVKSCILLAALFADGATSVVEPVLTRDHTERMLRLFGARVTSNGLCIRLEPGTVLTAQRLSIPKDISAAAFWIAAAALVPGSNMLLQDVGLNPGRTGFLDALKSMGADITVLPTAAADWEPVGSIKVLASRLSAIDIAPREVPSLVDELPMLAVCASMAEGTTRVTGAQELRVKESDRIAAIVTNLKAMGAAAGELSDGFWVTGGRKLHGTRIITMGDHRIAMAFSVAALVAEGETVLDNPQCIDVSYPGFLKQIRNLTGNSHD